MRSMRCFVCLLLCLLLMAGCTPEAPNGQTEFRVSCFRCGERFPSGQINGDFGLCQQCLMEAGAAYCSGCQKPCYTRDLVQGLCQDCNDQQAQTTAATEPTTTEPAQTEATQPPAPQRMLCQYCGSKVYEQYMFGEYCAGCYCIRMGMCLRCQTVQHTDNSCYCDSCNLLFPYCKLCGKQVPVFDSVMDVCTACYYRENGVVVRCPLCGINLMPYEVNRGYCNSCRIQADYHEAKYTCVGCGKGGLYIDQLTEDLCETCYAQCPKCKMYPRDNEGSLQGYCPACVVGQRVLAGPYEAVYENIRIQLQHHHKYGFSIIYYDLESGITLKDIPLAYYNENTVDRIALMFLVDDAYPQYEGYVEFIWARNGLYTFSYNALIEGLHGTGGDYSVLESVEDDYPYGFDA